jgi:hypothetical protein
VSGGRRPGSNWVERLEARDERAAAHRPARPAERLEEDRGRAVRLEHRGALPGGPAGRELREPRAPLRLLVHRQGGVREEDVALQLPRRLERRPRDEGAREEEVRRPPRVARRPGERRERRVVAEEDHRADALRREVPRRRRRQRAGRVPHRLDRSEAALLELRARGRGGLLEARVRGVDHRDRRARGAEPARGEVGEDAGLLAHIAQWNVLRRITSGSGGRCFVMVAIASSHSVMIRSCGKWYPSLFSTASNWMFVPL